MQSFGSALCDFECIGRAPLAEPCGPEAGKRYGKDCRWTYRSVFITVFFPGTRGPRVMRRGKYRSRNITTGYIFRNAGGRWTAEMTRSQSARASYGVTAAGSGHRQPAGDGLRRRRGRRAVLVAALVSRPDPLGDPPFQPAHPPSPDRSNFTARSDGHLDLHPLHPNVHSRAAGDRTTFVLGAVALWRSTTQPMEAVVSESIRKILLLSSVRAPRP
jgi:hypothetical protein